MLIYILIVFDNPSVICFVNILLSLLKKIYQQTTVSLIIVKICRLIRDMVTNINMPCIDTILR